MFNDDNAQRPPQLHETHRKLEKQNKKSVGRKKSAKFRPPPGPPPQGPPPPWTAPTQTTRPNLPQPWWNTGGRTSWTQKFFFFERRTRKVFSRVEISFFFEVGSEAADPSGVLSPCGFGAGVVVSLTLLASRASGGHSLASDDPAPGALAVFQSSRAA